MTDSEEIPEDILKEAERVLAGFKVTVSGEPQVTVFDYPQWRLSIAFALLRERRRHETRTPPPSSHLLASEWTDEDRAKAWRDAFDAMHQRAMRAEKCIRDNWLGGYWRSVDFSQANEVRIILADAPLATTEGKDDG